MWRIVFAVTLACMCGCSSDTAGPNAGAELGTYSLVLLDMQGLPASIMEGGQEVEVLSSSLILSTGRRLRMTTTFRPSPGATPVSNEVTGSYTLKGNDFTFTYNNGGRNSGTLNGNTIQMLNEGVVWLFQKS
jgi:hypothetical protein